MTYKHVRFGCKSDEAHTYTDIRWFMLQKKLAKLKPQSLDTRCDEDFNGIVAEMHCRKSWAGLRCGLDSVLF